MVLVIFWVDVVLLVSFDVGLCSVNTWYNPEHISWYPLWFLATSNFSWLIPTFSVILNDQYSLDHDFLVIFVLIFSCYWEYIFAYPYKQFCFIPKFVYFLSSTLIILLIILFHFITSLLIDLSLQLYCFFSIM